MKIKLFFIVFIIFSIISCTNQGKDIQNIRQGDSYIEQVKADNSEDLKLTHILNAVDKYIDGKLYNKADTLLSSLDTSKFNNDQQNKYYLLEAKYNAEILKFNKAQFYINKVNNNNLKDKDELAKYYKLKFQINYALNKNIDAIPAQIQYVNYLDNYNGYNEIIDTNKQIWDNLVKLSKSQVLNLKRQYNSNSKIKGWLDLALVYNNGEENLTDKNINPYEKYNKLNNWYTSNSNHDAVKLINANNDQAFKSLDSYKPRKIQKIAMLLPMSGKYKPIADSIKVGFLAGYYHSPERDSISISFIDSQSDYNINNIDADIIVGPLGKTEVKKVVKNKDDNDIKVLALNYTKKNKNPSVFQFGISAEDEAEQAAIRINNLGFQNVLVISEKSPWGDRVYSSFKAKHEELNNNIVGVGYIEDKINYQEKISKLLGIDDSNYRKYKLSKTLGAKLTHIPQRRNDIDSIFIALSAPEAKQVVPLLKYFYADNIPVFAVSSVFNEKTFDNNNNDLNNVQFCDIPGNLPENLENNEFNYKQYLTNHMHNTTIKNRRLFALGMDAFKLSLKLNEMQQMPLMIISGVTGKLNLSDEHKIKRNLPWAKINKNKVVVIG